MAMRARDVAVSAVALVAVVLGGCDKKKESAPNLADGINSYYAAHPVCLYPSEKKFPAQADTNNDADTAGYDALVQQGLLTRTTAEKTKMIVLSKQVNNYDLSDKGRGAWTADAQNPGYGNFCYAKRKVQNITSVPPAGEPAVGATTTVNYTYTLTDVADWARAAVVQTAYPKVQAMLGAASNGTNTMVLTANGWQVQKPSGSGIVE